MNFKAKINSIKKDAASLRKSLRGASFADFAVVYKRFMKRLPDISHLKNIVLFSGVASLLILIFFANRFGALYEYLPKKPVEGGTYSEGIVGKVEQFNPIYASVNPAEDTVASLIFSGLTKRDGNRIVIPALAESWVISEDGKTYTFKLRQGAIWEDGHRLTADDVLFTINTIQNPDVRSPLLEVWKNVEAEAPNQETVVLKLKSPYTGFIYNTNMPIIPKHILEMIPPRNLKIAEFNTQPTASGPFTLESIKDIKESQEIVLKRNDNYFGKRAYLDKIVIRTYPNLGHLASAYARKEIMGLEKVNETVLQKTRQLPNIKLYEMAIPQYDALYFNLRSGASKEKSFREAVSLAISREEIVKGPFQGSAVSIFSPILPGYLGNPGREGRPVSNMTLAKEKLMAGGFVQASDGLMKGDQRVAVRLLSSDDNQKSKEADMIATKLKELGVDVKVEKYPFAALAQEHIRPRDFDLLLVSQNLGSDPDLYAFWHSSQANDPGLNFSGFSDRKIDKFLEQARALKKPEDIKAKYLEITKTLQDELPALFLVWPNSVYGVAKDVKGVDIKKLVEPRDRFWNIENWYVLEKKV